jgi:hypothetical protein
MAWHAAWQADFDICIYIYYIYDIYVWYIYICIFDIYIDSWFMSSVGTSESWTINFVTRSVIFSPFQHMEVISIWRLDFSIFGSPDVTGKSWFSAANAARLSKKARWGSHRFTLLGIMIQIDKRVVPELEKTKQHGDYPWRRPEIKKC